MFQPKITKEEVNLLPTDEFAGTIRLIDNLPDCNQAVEVLKAQKIIGLDTETRPSFKRGVVYKMSLLQLCTDDICFLFRLHKIGLPPSLARLFSDKATTKVGLSLRDDLNGLFKQHNFKPNGFVDIQNLARDYGILELSLQKIYALIFGKKISKSQRLTNWENETLTEHQQRYAATDAWATLQIYKQLLQAKKLTRAEVERLIAESAAN